MAFSMIELGNSMSLVTNMISSKRGNNFDPNYNKQVETIFQQVLQENLRLYASSLSGADNGCIQFITSNYDQGFGGSGAKNGKIDASELLEMSTHVDWFFDPNNKNNDKCKNISEAVKEFFVNFFKSLGAALANIDKYLGSNPSAQQAVAPQSRPCGNATCTNCGKCTGSAPAATTPAAATAAQAQETPKPEPKIITVDAWGTGNRNDCWWNIVKNNYPGIPAGQINDAINKVAAKNGKTSSSVIHPGDKIILPDISELNLQSGQQLMGASQPTQSSSSSSTVQSTTSSSVQDTAPAPAKPSRSQLLQQIQSKGIVVPNLEYASYEELAEIAEH